MAPITHRPTHIDRDREWGTDVEILTLAYLLKTPVYTYHAATKNWNKYCPNGVDRTLTERDIDERGMYIQLEGSHF